MIATNGEIRTRIDQLKLSYDGYTRQLTRPNLSEERQERLQNSVQMLAQEIATLETLAQFGRIEADRDKIEAEVKQRVSIVTQRLADDPALDGYTQEQREITSGELKALQWALGEDKLMKSTQQWSRETAYDPTRARRVLPALLDNVVREGENADTRANAAYDAGQLHILAAIPVLASVLDDEPIVATTALQALCQFTPEELHAANLEEQVLARIAAARQQA